MSSPTNLTDRITHLRDRKKQSATVSGNTSRNSPRPGKASKKKYERRFATDLFMMVAYSLLCVAVIAQIFLIIWLDII